MPAPSGNGPDPRFEPLARSPDPAAATDTEPAATAQRQPAPAGVPPPGGPAPGGAVPAQYSVPESAPAQYAAPGQYPTPAQSSGPAQYAVLGGAGVAVPGAAAARRRPRWPVTLAVAAVAVICLIAAFAAGSRAHAELVRKPTAAELSAAAALGVASRWQRWPAGQIFPAQLSYNTDLLTQETAQRAGIATDDTCTTALDPPVAAIARRHGCRAALRASYLDQLGGVVYTVGVLAFPSARSAAGFLGSYSPGRTPVSGLHALALPGTAAAAFTDAARQAATVIPDGPYVVLTVAGYADGRPSAATGESRASVFVPASQLATDIAAPLDQPVTVRCATPEWSC